MEKKDYVLLREESISGIRHPLLVLTGYIFVLTNNNYGNKNHDMKKYYKKIMLIFLPMTLLGIGTTYFAPLYSVNEYPKYYNEVKNRVTALAQTITS